MSIVRYTNKKTGIVSIYESTSHYDPATKSSRPVRKYLGKEDPVTGELIPTSKRRGRKKSTTVSEDNASNAETIQKLKEQILILEKQCEEKELKNHLLEAEKQRLLENLEKIESIIERAKLN